MANDDWLQKTAYDLWELGQGAGWDLKSNPEALAERLRRLASGLPFEDEFIALLIWLGRCQLVHKLEQPGWPLRAGNHYEIPDLLVFLTNDDGSPRPMLVEVKATQRSRLKRTSKYWSRLRRYADICGLPLMIAWWNKSVGAWTLFDADLFSGRNQLSFADAFKNSQLSTLAGDFGVTVQPGCGLRIRMRPLRGEDGRPPEFRDGLLDEGWYSVEIEHARWLDRSGREVRRLPDGLFPFLAGCCDESEMSWDDGVAVQTHRASGDAMVFAHSAFHSQLTKDDNPPAWRQLLQTEAFPMDVQALRHSLDTAGDFIQMKFFYQPATDEPEAR